MILIPLDYNNHVILPVYLLLLILVLLRFYSNTSLFSVYKEFVIKVFSNLLLNEFVVDGSILALNPNFYLLETVIFNA